MCPFDWMLISFHYFYRDCWIMSLLNCSIFCTSSGWILTARTRIKSQQNQMNFTFVNNYLFINSYLICKTKIKHILLAYLYKLCMHVCMYAYIMINQHWLSVRLCILHASNRMEIGHYIEDGVTYSTNLHTISFTVVPSSSCDESNCIRTSSYVTIVPAI